MTMPVWYVFGFWMLWILQFVLFHPKGRSAVVRTAPNSRWGMFLQLLGAWAIFLPGRTLFIQPLPVWRLLAGTCFGLVGIWLASAGIRHLGRQWRTVAALSADHQLVTSGPYRIVRHPIYASMLAMIVMSAFFVGRLPYWPIGIALFLAGIRLRSHVEDGLLRDRFGARFEEWERAVPSCLPRIRLKRIAARAK